MDIVLLSRLIISSINLTILVVIIYILVKKYRELPSTFTLGFLLFALALFFRTLFAAPMLKVFVFGIPSASVVDPYRLIADIFELISLLVFIYITTR